MSTLLSKEEFKKKSDLVISKDFNNQLPSLKQFLEFSTAPIFRSLGSYSLVLQLSMIQRIFKFETAIQEGKKRLKNEKRKERRISLEKGVLINRSCVRIIKTIADGLAWRAFRCHRPRLMIMSDNLSSGATNPSDPVFEVLKYRSGFFIINDLTRWLRTGDVTYVGKDGSLVVEEFKDNGQSLKNMGSILGRMSKFNQPPSKQEERILIVQSALMSDELIVPDDAGKELVSKAKFLSLDFEIPSHLSKMRALIKIANKQGFSHALIEDGYYVEVHAYDTLYKSNNFDDVFKDLKEDSKRNRPDWIDSEDAEIEYLSNYDAFLDAGDEFPRNITPPSILPFSINDRLRIMSGHLFIKVFVNVGALKKILELDGWSVEKGPLPSDLKTRKDFAKRRSETRGKFATYGENIGLHFVLRRQDGSRVYKGIFPYELIYIMMSSFHAFEFISKAMQEIYAKRYEVKTDAVMLNFPGEYRLFFKDRLRDFFYSSHLLLIFVEHSFSYFLFKRWKK